MGYRDILGLLSVVLCFTSYIPYIRDVLKGKTHPHAFSWITWSILAAIASAIQLSHNAGPGAWIWMFNVLANLVIFWLALTRGDKDIALIDIISLSGAGLSILLWAITDDPVISIILICFVEALGGFFPTFRKSVHHPEKETVSAYAISSTYMLISLFALKEFTFETAFYTCACFAMCTSLIFFLLIRRTQISTT